MLCSGCHAVTYVRAVCAWEEGAGVVGGEGTIVRSSDGERGKGPVILHAEVLHDDCASCVVRCVHMRVHAYVLVLQVLLRHVSEGSMARPQKGVPQGAGHCQEMT